MIVINTYGKNTSTRISGKRKSGDFNGYGSEKIYGKLGIITRRAAAE